MDKSSSSLQTWRSGIAVNLASNLIGFLVGGFMTYISHLGSSWTVPVLYGGLAWLLILYPHREQGS